MVQLKMHTWWEQKLPIQMVKNMELVGHDAAAEFVPGVCPGACFCYDCALCECGKYDLSSFWHPSGWI